MAKSLRYEVEALAVQLEEYQEVRSDYDSGRASRSEWAADRLREILDRHPPADGAVVPRELLIGLRNDADRCLAFSTDGYHWDEINGRIAQADAILAEGKS